MTQVTVAMSIARPTRLAKPKTTPDRTLFCRKGVTSVLGPIDVCPPGGAVKVIVCPATVVTITGAEVVVDAEEEKVVEEERVVEEENVEVVLEVLVEWVEDAEGSVPDVLSVGWADGVGKRSLRKPSCLAWSNFKS